MTTKATLAQLKTRTTRALLTPGTRLSIGVGAGVYLFYRRGRKAGGTWQARRRVGTGYRFEALGRADDVEPANDYDVLDYHTACERARTWARESAHAPATAAAGAPRTVGDVLDLYLADFKAQKKRGLGTARSIINRALRPELGALPLAQLTSEHLRAWLLAMEGRGRALRAKRGQAPVHLPAPVGADAIRARRATVNRQFSVLRAALNLAFRRELIGNDQVWRRVKPFGNVDEPRIRFLTSEESVTLVEACAPDLRQLVRGALLTGARFGELAAAVVGDFQASTGQFYVARSKSGRPRHVPLNAEGLALFTEIAGERPADEPLFRRTSGTFWGSGDYRRGLGLACAAAEISPPIAFHELRHTYASLLAQAGCDLLTISKLLGHADTRVTSKHYAHLCDRTLRAAVTHLPAFTVMPPPAPPPANVLAFDAARTRRRA